MTTTEEQDLVISPGIARLLRGVVEVERGLADQRKAFAVLGGSWSREECDAYDLLRERHAAAAHDVATTLRVVLDTYGQPA